MGIVRVTNVIYQNLSKNVPDLFNFILELLGGRAPHIGSAVKTGNSVLYKSIIVWGLLHMGVGEKTSTVFESRWCVVRSPNRH